jgi:curved DNA binding protein
MTVDVENDLPTIADDLVVTKYKMAAEIVNKVLKEMVEACKPGESVRDLCILGDKKLKEETGKAFKKDKKLTKGIAFPTCISCNNCICHYSPLTSEPDSSLADGDLVKIDMAAHIDGFIATVAHSFVIGATAENPVTGRKADAMMAAHLASEAALRLVKPGNDNIEVTETVNKVADSFECKPVEGMVSHQLEQNKIDGDKTILHSLTEAQSKEHDTFAFGLHEVYGVDVLVSTGDGTNKEKDAKTVIFKKTDMTYMLKMKTSREFLSNVTKTYGSMPFNLRNFDEEKKARMGVVECVKHQVVQPFHVLYEKEGNSVAQFKFTVLLMPNGPQKITGLPFDAALYKSEKAVEDGEILTLLKQSANPKAAKKKKKAAEKAVTEETSGDKKVEEVDMDAAPTLVEQ